MNGLKIRILSIIGKMLKYGYNIKLIIKESIMFQPLMLDGQKCLDYRVLIPLDF